MRWTALLMALALVLAACGGDDDDGSQTSVTITSSPASTTTAAPTSTSTPTSAPASTGPSTTAPDGAESSTTAPGDPSDDRSGPSTLDATSTVSTVGFDEVTFGMTVVQAEEAANTRMLPLSTPNEDCYEVEPEGGPEGVTFMVTEGTIERVDVRSGGITTRSGAGIGSTEQEVLDLFGTSIELRPDPDGGNQLVFVPSDETDAEFRVIFVSDGTTITSFRSGRLPQVELRGCP
jgi:hypothetical protein